MISVMSVELIIVVALAAAIINIILALVLIIVFQRWRICDNNVHLEKFINENLQLREKIRQYNNL
jgi:hypothetical protein